MKITKNINADGTVTYASGTLEITINGQKPVKKIKMNLKDEAANKLLTDPEKYDVDINGDKVTVVQKNAEPE